MREWAKKERKTLPMPPRSRVCKGSYERGNTMCSSSSLGDHNLTWQRSCPSPAGGFLSHHPSSFSHTGYHLVRCHLLLLQLTFRTH